jgi:hypothetical protein
MKCIWCLSGQCIHAGHHDDGGEIPAAITVQAGDAYCADCIAPYVRWIRERVASGELGGMGDRPS